jgi:hypothetical protein
VDDLIGIGVAVCVAFLYLMFAGAVAALGAVVGAGEAVAMFVSRLGGIVVLGIKNRGGDQRVPCPPEPAFEFYVGPPLIRDFRQAFVVAAGELQSQAPKRRKEAADRYKGAVRPMAWGIGLGAYVGSAIGIVVGSLFAVVLGVVVLIVAGSVWATAHLLQALEKIRRRLRGAHFDCPSCHERSPLPVYVCPACGSKHAQLLPGRWGIRRRRCQCDQVSLPVLESGGRHSLTAECPRCAHFMPGASGIVPEVSVPIVGGPKAGKTAMLASVLVELDDRTRAGSSRLAVIEDSRVAFDQLVGDLRAGRPPAKTLDRDTTPALVAEVRSGASRSALLYAHDVAGERFQQADAVRDMTPLTRARGAVVLIDPFSLHAVGAELEGRDADKALIDPSAEDPQSVVERFIQTLRESGRSDFKRLPVAVVVSKTDALDSGERIRPGDQGDSVVKWLEDHGGGNLVRMLMGEFETIRFFAASALGRIPDPRDASAFSPAGTLEPFLWLLAENKISIGSEAASTVETVTEKLGSAKGAQPVEAWPKTPLFAPRPPSTRDYAIGIAVVLLAVIAVIVVVAGTSQSHTQNAAYVGSASASGSGNSGFTSSGSGDTGSGDTGSGDTGSGDTGSGDTGSGDTGSGDTGSGDTGSGDTGSGDTGSMPQMPSRVANAYASRSGASDVAGIGPESCAPGVTISGRHTDCAFAKSVETAYEDSGTENGTVSAKSPVDPSLGSIQMQCTVYSRNVVACIGGLNNKAIVFFHSG